MINYVWRTWISPPLCAVNRSDCYSHYPVTLTQPWKTSNVFMFFFVFCVCVFVCVWNQFPPFTKARFLLTCKASKHTHTAHWQKRDGSSLFRQLWATRLLSELPRLPWLRNRVCGPWSRMLWSDTWAEGNWLSFHRWFHATRDALMLERQWDISGRSHAAAADTGDVGGGQAGSGSNRIKPDPTSFCRDERAFPISPPANSPTANYAKMFHQVKCALLQLSSS